MREIYSPLGVICWLLSQYLRANTLQRVRYKQRCADTSLDPRMLFLLHKLYSDAPSWAHCHTDTLSPRIKNCTHLHAGTQTHPAKQDYPCQSFGRALIWSNGGSESWFVFPSVVRPRSSLPGDTTSCILTPPGTEIHPPTRRPEYLTCAHKYRDCCVHQLTYQSLMPVTEPLITKSSIKAYTLSRAHHFFVFEALPPLHFFFLFFF